MTTPRSAQSDAPFLGPFGSSRPWERPEVAQGPNVRAFRSRRAGAIWGGIWLVYLAPAFGDAATTSRGPLAAVLGVMLLLAFGLIYLLAMLAAWGPDLERGGMPKNGWDVPFDGTQGWVTGSLTLLSVAAVAVIGEQGVATFVFLAPVAASLLPGRRAMIGVATAVLATFAAELLMQRIGAGSARDDGVGDALGTAFSALMAGFLTLAVRRMRLIMWELHLARQDASRLASAEERVRIARDLHDVLGHGLTVISMRSQLAARLSERGEFDRAREEMQAVEVLSRTAMSDVREAVAGYRIRAFPAELAAAEATLQSAGLETIVVPPSLGLPAAGEDALGFVVREGVTNVLRHGSATRCSITVTHSGSSVVVQVADDGRGAGHPLRRVAAADGAGTPAGAEGSGLPGLAERVAAVGGMLSAGDAEGGFVLRAEVPR